MKKFWHSTRSASEIDSALSSDLPRINRPLGPRLLKYILLFSSVFTAVTTSVSYFLDYTAEMDEVKQLFEQIRRGTVPGLAGAMWELNDALIEQHLDGVVKIADVVSIKLLDDDGNTIGHHIDPDRSQEYLITEIIPIKKDSSGKEVLLGQLHVQVTKLGILTRIRDRAIMFFVLQGLKTFFVSLVILQIFHLLLTRDLGRISSWLLKSSAKGNLTEVPDNKRNPKVVDELSVLIHSLNAMGRKITEQKRRIEEMLALTQGKLDLQTIRLKKRNYQIETLASMNENLTRDHDPKNTLLIGCRYLSRVFGSANVLLFQHAQEKDRSKFYLKARHPVSGPAEGVEVYDPKISGLDKNKVLQNFLSDPSKLQAMSETLNENIPSLSLAGSEATWHFLPFQLAQTEWGFVAVKAPEDCKSVAPRFIQSIELFYEKNLLHQRIVQFSITDHLTGLYNARHFRQCLDSELKRCSRTNQPLSLLFLDIDKFKNYNDTNGHLAGDQLLVEFSAVLSKSFRGTDIVARYGGEEFGVILVDTGLEAAQEKAKSLRAAIEAHRFPLGQSQPGGSLTASIGVAAFPEHGGDASEMLDLADQALYKAKQDRNSVVVAPLSPDKIQQAKNKRRVA